MIYLRVGPEGMEMKNAKELLYDYLELVQDADRTTALFAKDGAIELPYLESLGIQSAYVGHEEIHDFLKSPPALSGAAGAWTDCDA
jgi:hypothetical protein